MMRTEPLRAIAVIGVLTSAVLVTTACAPLLIGGAILGGSLIATDRRSPGTQLDDQAIEVKAANRVGDAIGNRGRVSATSYNRWVLLTGEVPSEADKLAVERGVARIENVRSVVNELAIGPSSSLGTRSNDAVLSGKVKASLVDARDLHANAIKVVSEGGVVYLMGRATEREATRAAEVARGVGGVRKVVRVFEIVSEAELANQPAPAASRP